MSRTSLSFAPQAAGALEEGSSTPPAAPYSTQPVRPRCPPFPKDSTTKEVLKWREECAKVREARAKEDAHNNFPTRRAPKDMGTTNAVLDPRHKEVVLAAARSIVSVTPISDDGPKRPQCTGFIIDRFLRSGDLWAVIVTCSKVVCKEGRKLDPLPKLLVGLPDRKTFMYAQLLCFSDHYDIALLCLPMKSSLVLPRIGCCPEYNQKVFVLARDKEASLRVRAGVISWLEEADYLGHNYSMFLDGEIPEGGTGGLVIDHDGEFRGMAFHCSPKPAVLSISTISTCFKMYVKYRCLPRPMLGLGLKTISSADVDLLECLSHHKIKSGFIVDVVEDDSDAESCGIVEGNVIVSINEKNGLTLPELEDHLLSFAWDILSKSVSTVNLKLVVCDLKGHTRNITLPLRFSYNPERVWPVYG